MINWQSHSFETQIEYTRDGTVFQQTMQNHYWHSPNPGKPKLLLLHGWAEYGLDMARLAEPFAADYDILAPDARAHGHTDGPPSLYTITERVFDLTAVLHETNFTDCVVIGHSMGANIATAAALLHPDWFKGLVLIDPSWGGGLETMNDTEGAVTYWSRTIQQWQRFSEAQLLRFAQRNFPEWHPQDHEHWVTGKKLIKETTVDGYRWTVPMWEDYIDRIPNPGVLVTGDVDQGAIVSPEYAAASLSRWSGLREVVHIPAAGHYIHHYDVEPIQRATQALAEDVFSNHV